MKKNNTVSLQEYNTFGVAASTPLFVEIKSSLALQEKLKDEAFKDALILGGGSNILFIADLSRPVIKISIPGIRIINETEQIAVVSAGAGVVWHDLVMWCVANNLGGIENLSLIPGLVGAAPIQNIGAYGVELSDVFYDAVCINRKTGESRIFNAEDCDFGYRDSAFKNDLKDAYVVSAVRLALTKKNHSLKTDYGNVTETLAKMGVTKPNIEDVAKAVVQIRTSKLPDPKKLGNAGSFFKNPIVPKGECARLLLQYPNMPHYQIDGAFDKIPAGWLIEQAGFKGLKKGKVGMHDKQALVLVNYGTPSGKLLWKYAKLVMEGVEKKFGISLEPEVNLIR